MNSSVSGQHETCPHNARPRAWAAAIASRSSNTASGRVALCSNAAIITGRPVSAANDSRNGIVVSPPLVSMKIPRPTSPNAPTSARISCSSASREGIGSPPAPLCDGEVEVAKPMAPAPIASTTRRRISATSSARAARRGASSPIT